MLFQLGTVRVKEADKWVKCLFSWLCHSWQGHVSGGGWEITRKRYFQLLTTSNIHWYQLATRSFKLNQLLKYVWLKDGDIAIQSKYEGEFWTESSLYKGLLLIFCLFNCSVKVVAAGCCSEMACHPWVAEKRFHTGGLPFLSYINHVAVLTAKFTQLQYISVRSS